jgi:tetratricopeptide (TPR) repeat protein
MPADAPRPSSPQIRSLQRQLAKDPGSKAFLPLAEELAKIGRFAEAAALIEQGLTRYPTFILARAALGRIYHQAGDRAKAKAVLEEAVRLSPENLLAHRTLARIYLDERAVESAGRSCAVLLAANPSDPDARALRELIESAASAGPATSASSEASGHPAAGVSLEGRGRPERERKVEALTAWLARIRERRA